ncbi:hypothetical protein RHGRI_030426 [Rhododendron griersonianum]|uniref:Secreted protein n=1 Tax=Rhododendron griersonianum TaxID=479676 RepID=A0AAV6IMX4_9ERIC|nr:hypothetical protein RHGRI_030426 [Rhododendron griersonianum]
MILSVNSMIKPWFLLPHFSLVFVSFSQALSYAPILLGLQSLLRANVLQEIPVYIVGEPSESLELVGYRRANRENSIHWASCSYNYCCGFYHTETTGENTIHCSSSHSIVLRLSCLAWGLL